VTRGRSALLVAIGVALALVACVAALYLGPALGIAGLGVLRRAQVVDRAVDDVSPKPVAETSADAPGIAGRPESAGPAPEGHPAPPALTREQATAAVTAYLAHAKAGRRDQARAMTTERYRSRMVGDYYALARENLRDWRVRDAEARDGGWVVTVVETWSDGDWVNWYLVTAKDGRTVLDDTGTE
jgi:hypothetical protein